MWTACLFNRRLCKTTGSFCFSGRIIAFTLYNCLVSAGNIGYFSGTADDVYQIPVTKLFCPRILLFYLSILLIGWIIDLWFSFISTITRTSIVCAVHCSRAYALRFGIIIHRHDGMIQSFHENLKVCNALFSPTVIHWPQFYWSKIRFKFTGFRLTYWNRQLPGVHSSEKS